MDGKTCQICEKQVDDPRYFKLYKPNGSWKYIIYCIDCGGFLIEKTDIDFLPLLKYLYS